MLREIVTLVTKPFVIDDQNLRTYLHIQISGYVGCGGAVLPPSHQIPTQPNPPPETINLRQTESCQLKTENFPPNA